MSMIIENLNKIRETIKRYKAIPGKDVDITAAVLEDCMEIIEHLSANIHSEWIPCSERLPEETGYYQVTVKMKETGECFVERKHYKTEKGWDNALTRDFIDVIAWQPLPEAYKE